MKKGFFLIFTLFVLALNTQAQTQSKDEKEVAAAVAKLRQGMLDGDKNALDQVTSADLTYGHSNGKLEDKATFISVLASGENDFVTMDVTDQTIKILGNTAIVRHNFSAQTNNGGTPGSTKLGVLLVWQKQQGKWKLVARQAFKLT
ncbi:nuclear transport factor 2 family protein [Adhaeribacter swui]|uniref:Nuclear transport factor 2 family protein n=1 Tax=Adhaeribacter swui TaxID=2086471 RepID=A0A7G7G6L9_9BACT|nr:nuclear transport factor 2 family protein [Adhaeribacter swui]QNF32803.1 nuclear transport factor 2 family protein [Adhaeribacter swui]